MTADGEQTGQDAERTNTRADSLGEVIKELVRDAEGITEVTVQSFFSPSRKVEKGITRTGMLE